MFYENQPECNRNDYKKMLTIMGNLTRLFSDSQSPYLAYRAHENIFCKYMSAENLARQDCSADAQKGRIGLGLKTWVGNNDQKVAEFGKLRETFSDLSGLDLVKKIAEYRNSRIKVTKNMHDIDTLIYHIVKRIPGSMQIFEYAFDEIDIEHLQVIKNRGNNNNTYFTDGKHTYHFSKSKNTLYMLFEGMTPLDSFEVQIMDDPYSFLMRLMDNNTDAESVATVKEMIQYTESVSLPRICLRLYTFTKKHGKTVAEQSGLNQWNGYRKNSKTGAKKKRNINELYIPYPAPDRRRNEGFFPERGKKFQLTLPNGVTIPAKVCQDDGKAIMSNPNNLLGKWLLRDVFELPENTIVTYEMLEQFGIDSVIFTKHSDTEYSVAFSEIGTYEEFYGLNDTQ